MLVIISFTLFLTGCEFSYTGYGQARTFSGYVYYENQALENVLIQNELTTFAITNQEGFYTFTTRLKTFTIKAKKAGYEFQPKLITIDADSQNQFDFSATEATPLNGILNLKQILISPTSIVSLPDNNYLYTTNSINNLKISEFVLKFNYQDEIQISQTQYLAKNTYTNILPNEQSLQVEIIDGQTNFTFEFLMKAYFTYNNGLNQSIDNEDIFSVLSVSSNLDSGDLDEESNLSFIAKGINSTSGGYTYNIKFIFEIN